MMVKRKNKRERSLSNTILLVLLAGIVTALALWLIGCSMLTPADMAYFDNQADQAAVFNLAVQADPNTPDAVKRWIAAEAEQRAIESDWAHFRRGLDGNE